MADESSSESHHGAADIAQYYGSIDPDVEDVPNEKGIKVVKRKNRTYHKNYQEQLYAQEDAVNHRDLRIGAKFIKNFHEDSDSDDSVNGGSGNIGYFNLQDIAVVLGKKTMNRKNHRQYIESKVGLTLYRYLNHQNSKQRNGVDGLAFKRGTVSARDRDVRRFTQDIDYYSQLHGNNVIGFDLEAVLDALSVSESAMAKTKDRYEVRSSQILRSPLRVHGIDFFHFYPYVLPEKRRRDANARRQNDTDASSVGDDAPINEDFLLAGYTDEEIGIVNSRNNANNSQRINRVMTKNRCIPVYLLPLFLSGQSAMISSCNSALNISFKLHELMRSKRDMFPELRACFDDSILQLKANMLMIMKSTEDAANLMQDVMRSGSYMRSLYDQLIERLQCYDYELYEKIMFDRGIASSMKMSLNMPVLQTQNALPVVDINYERRYSLFRIFDDFMNEYEKRHNHWNSDNRVLFQEERVRQLQRFDLMDTMTRYLLYGLKVTYPVENIIHVFRSYMQANYEQMDEIAVGYFKELDSAYAMRLVEVGASQAEDRIQETLTEALAIKTEIETITLKECKDQLALMEERTTRINKRIDQLKKGRREEKKKKKHQKKKDAKLAESMRRRTTSEDVDIYGSPDRVKESNHLSSSRAEKNSSPRGTKRKITIAFGSDSEDDDAKENNSTPVHNDDDDNMDVEAGEKIAAEEEKEEEEEEEEEEELDSIPFQNTPIKKRRIILGGDSDSD